MIVRVLDLFFRQAIKKFLQAFIIESCTCSKNKGSILTISDQEKKNLTLLFLGKCFITLALIAIGVRKKLMIVEVLQSFILSALLLLIAPIKVFSQSSPPRLPAVP